MFPALILFLVFVACMLVAAFKDATTFTIPNWISLAIIAAFIAVVPFTWQGVGVLGEHVLVGLAFFAAGFTMFALGWLGGGDAKMMAATALWWTWPDAVTYIFSTTVVGLGLAVVIILGRNFIPVRVLTSPWTHKIFKEEKNMPYGIALAAGGVITLLQSDIYMQALAG
ncbi:prepilin peptidase [Litorimonas sp. RW-G-Af-16]|uniref:A24 family peptidase n=1 Tax=Litorimonas sp. RW-G-Af-16 TaxID=3241168 RepID=UPI00390CBFF4